MTTPRLWLSVVRVLLYGLVPGALLRARLSQRLGRSGRACHLVTSGRVALMLVAQAVAGRTSSRIALVPDYVCNVVHVAIERAGFRVEVYPTDLTCEPDDAYLRERLTQADIALLVTASVFGSSAWLHRLSNADVRSLVQRSGAHVIVDACQDISLLDQLPEGYGDALSVVVSFNDKSLPGMMGGGIVTSLPLPAEPSHTLTASQRSILRRMLLAKVRAWMSGRRPVKPADPFEFSYCQSFPYSFDTAGISKLQVVLALVGLDNLPAFRSGKRELFERCADNVIAPAFDTAAYVPVSAEGVMPNRRRKRPYAAPNEPSRSLRPHQTVLHNKGFSDEAGT